MRKLAALVGLLAVVGVGIYLGRSIETSREGTTRSLDTSTEQRPRQRQLAEKVEPSGRGIYWGVFNQELPYEISALSRIEAQVGRTPAIVMWYQEWGQQETFPVADARKLLARGIVPMVSWEPWQPPRILGERVVDQPHFRLRRIARGAFDTYILRYALSVREYGGPVMLRPFHEMDGFWYPWGGLVNGNKPRDFIAAWHHVYSIFERMGATNVTWVWSVNHLSVPDTPENSIDRYWPGSRYVDWIGLSGFNFGNASQYSSYLTFDQIYAKRMESLAAYDKPVILAEFASGETGGSKAAWIEDAFAQILDSYPKIRGAIWYDKRDSELQDWRIESSPAALAAFRRAVSGPSILGAATAAETAKSRARHTATP